MRTAFLLVIVCVPVIAIACTPSTPAPTPPTPDASDAAVVTACEAACANLAALGCAEGKSPSCVAVCEKSRSLTDIKPTCLAAASSKAAARACGSVTCP